MEAFEKLEVWKRSSRLCVDIYKVFAQCKDLGFKDQITRAVLSVPSNIAEGYERDSRKEYIRFLRIAKASSGELRTQLYIGQEVGFLDKSHAKKYLQEAYEISCMIQGLVKKLQPK